MVDFNFSFFLDLDFGFEIFEDLLWFLLFFDFDLEGFLNSEIYFLGLGLPFLSLISKWFPGLNKLSFFPEKFFLNSGLLNIDFLLTWSESFTFTTILLSLSCFSKLAIERNDFLREF